MKKSMNRFIAIALSFVMQAAKCPLSIIYEMAEVYKDELRDMGFSDAQIDEFTVITNASDTILPNAGVF